MRAAPYDVPYAFSGVTMMDLRCSRRRENLGMSIVCRGKVDLDVRAETIGNTRQRHAVYVGCVRIERDAITRLWQVLEQASIIMHGSQIAGVLLGEHRSSHPAM